MALDTMRRYLTPTEEEVEGGLARPTGPLASLGRASEMARIANTGPKLLEQYDVSQPVPGEDKPLTEEELIAARSAYAKRGQNLNPALRPKDLESPIPTASANTRTPSTEPVASTVPAVTKETPAGPADSSGKGSMVAPPSTPKVEGAGGDDDELRRLYLGQLAARAAAGIGNIVAGRQTDIGVGDVLGERMKQIQALRAKREEATAEQEKARREAAATGKVTSEMLQSLGITPPASLAELPTPELVLKAGKFPAEVAGIQALTAQRAAGVEVSKARLPLIGGQVALTDARTQSLLDKNQRDERALQLREEAQDSMNDLRRAQAESARAAALKAKNDPKAAMAVTNSVKKTVEASRKLVTPTANNFLAIEQVAPGMIRGEAPAWLTREAMAGTKVSKELAPKVADLNAAVEALVMDIRHGTFGASLTGTEKASFEQLITNSVKDGPEALARALNQLRQRAAQIAQDHFSFDMEFHPQEAARALRSSDIWKQALGQGGVYSDVWQMPETAPAAGGMTRMTGPDGQKYDVPNDKVEAAKAKGWKE